MNRFSAISVMRPLVGCANGSRCRTNIVAHPVAGVVKLTAAAVDGVSVTRWPAGGSGILAGKLTRRIMNTAGGGATDYENGQTEVVKTPEDVGTVSVEKKDTNTDGWESFQKRLIDDPIWRNDREMTAMFERWSAHYGKRYASEGEKNRRFGIFKKKMRLIDVQNSIINAVKVRLDAHCDLTAREFLSGLKNRKLCVESDN